MQRLAIAAILAIGCGNRDGAAGGRGGRDSPEPTIDAAIAASRADGDAAGDAEEGGFRIRFVEPHTGPVAAVRCTLAGDPLVVDCGHGPTVALDGAGRIYATDTTTVRRFVVATATAERCDLALDPTFATGGVLAQPDLPVVPQSMDDDGKLFMASGGPTWTVIAGAGTAMYYVEFLRGVHRIDRGRLEPVCPRLLGVRGIAPAADGKSAIVARGGADRIALRGRCTPAPATLEPAPQLVTTIAGDVWGATGADKVVRYDRTGAAAVTAGADDHFAPGGMCHVAAIAACGADRVCAIDSNCMKVEVFARDGTFVRELDDGALFATRPYGLRGGAGASDGALWLATEHKDGATCEGAIYRVAAPAGP